MGCVGGSFSAVTLALLETPTEGIPCLFQPWEILLGSGLVPTSSSCRRRSWTPLARACTSLQNMPAELAWGYPAPFTGVLHHIWDLKVI